MLNSTDQTKVKFLFNEKHKRSLNWIKLIALTGSAQAVVQVIGLVTGIIIIRLLPTKEYALYTVTNTVLGTLTLLADGGISTAVMAQGGKFWSDREKLGSVIVTGFDLRKKFGVIALSIAVPILFYLLRHQHASVPLAVLTVVALIPSFYAALSDNLLEIGPKLQQDISLLQKNQVLTGILRLGLTFFLIAIFPITFVAILANGIPRLWANVRLKKSSLKYVDFKQPKNVETRQSILKVVKRSLPEIIYYSLSGQITLWLISIFGSTTAVAQVGALGRISMILSLIGIIFSTLVIPRFARLKSSPRLLVKRFLQIHLICIILCLFIVCLTKLFSSQILWILGKNYLGLNHLLLLNMVAACISMVTGISFGLYSSRGFIINPLISIPVNILTIIIALLLFNVTTVSSVFVFNIFIVTVQLIMHFIFGIIKFQK